MHPKFVVLAIFAASVIHSSAYAKGGIASGGGIIDYFNSSQIPNLVTISPKQSAIAVQSRNSDGSYGNAVSYPTDLGPVVVGSADLANRGWPDVVVVNAGSGMGFGSVSVLLGDGNGQFAPAVNYPVGRNPHDVLVVDVNGDGIFDLVVVNQGGSISVLIGNGDGSFAPAVAYGAGMNPQTVIADDASGAGLPNLVIVGSNGSSRVLFNNGDGTFHPQQ